MIYYVYPLDHKMMKLVDGHDGYVLNIVDYKYFVSKQLFINVFNCFVRKPIQRTIWKIACQGLRNQFEAKEKP